MRLGIDLGTTFSCVAHVDEDGRPHVIPSAHGELTTPSIVWFDGKSAWVGNAAQLKKISAPHFVFEYVKRDMGKPVSASVNEMNLAAIAPYEVGGFKYGAEGISALILRKLKKDAVKYGKHAKLLDAAVDERDIELDAVITVPAYFRELQRQATMLAGHAAGLRVVDIINEPTAAARCYGFIAKERARLMVFDLGGGTFDVTLLEVNNGTVDVLTSLGDSALGGKDWDDLIAAHLYEQYERKSGGSLRDDPEQAFEVRQKAINAKLDLSREESVVVSLSGDKGDFDVVLYRKRRDASKFEIDDGTFYLEERASDFLHRCRILCDDALARVSVSGPGGRPRSMSWSDLDDIVLAGGSCRMPMIPEMLESIARRSVRRVVDGFNFDTAIASGAALYAHEPQTVQDVLSHSLGIAVERAGRLQMERLVHKDTQLPTEVIREFEAPPNAKLELYEGESTALDECTYRGRLELENKGNRVTVVINVTRSGTVHVKAGAPPDPVKEIILRNDQYAYDARANDLRTRIQSVTVKL